MVLKYLNSFFKIEKMLGKMLCNINIKPTKKNNQQQQLYCKNFYFH